MRQHTATRRIRLPIAIALLAAIAASVAGYAADKAPGVDTPKNDPLKVLGHEACAKCHEQEVTQWRTTPHYRTFDSLHRMPEAKAICDRLGLRSVKRNDTCVQCHYTGKDNRGRLRIVEGVGCESCHGAAQDWVNLHADYGGSNVSKQLESADHKAQRQATSIAAGMNNPSNLYLIARQCLGCHTTPDERLVNVGGHNAGSQDFELVAWSQGMVRHNFQRSNGQANASSDPARLRVMYLVGALTDLEFSLRATAKATAADRFGSTVAARAARTKQRLWEMQRVLKHPMLGEALAAVAEVELTLENAVAISAAANEVGDVADQISRTADGATLTAIDPFLPAPNTYK